MKAGELKAGQRVFDLDRIQHGCEPDRFAGIGKIHMGTVLAPNDPRVWIGTLAFPTGHTPTQAQVDKHIASVKAMDAMLLGDDKVPVAWDFGCVYWHDVAILNYAGSDDDDRKYIGMHAVRDGQIVILAALPGNEGTPFVTWMSRRDSNVMRATYWGHYHATQSEAEAEYRERIEANTR